MTVTNLGLRVVLAAVLVLGCTTSPAAPTGQPTPTTSRPSASLPTTPPAATPTIHPTAAPSTRATPNATDNPTSNLPRVGTTLETGRFPVTLAADGVLLAQKGEPVVIQRTDAHALSDMGDVDLGSTGGFPPDAQTIVAGNGGGVWVPLAAQRAVAKIEPVSGDVTRRLDVDAAAYSLIEHEGDLWIVDLESDEVVRFNLKDERELARIKVVHPVGIAYDEGFMWVVQNAGRHEPSEPLSGPGGQLAKIDVETNLVTKYVPVGHRPLFVASGWGAIWTSNATSGSVSRVDSVTDDVIDIPVGADGAFDIEVTIRGVFVVIGPQWGPPCDPQDSYFVRIDPETHAVSARIDSPCPSSLTSDGGYGLWISGEDDQGVISSHVTGLEPI